MATAVEEAALVLPDRYDERAAFETPSRGYLEGASVRLANGSRYSIVFYDPVRLGQDSEGIRPPRPAVLRGAEPIVLPEVTEAAMCTAVEELARQGFFQQPKPLA